MATLSQGILGPISGKVGTVVGGSWKGIDYIRSLAPSIVNPNTPAQQEQRMRFSLMLVFLRSMVSFLRVGYRASALKMTAFNAAMSHNVKHAIKGVFPTLELDYPQILVSKGNLVGAENPAALATVGGHITVTWDDNSLDEGASATDKACVIIYNPSNLKTLAEIGPATRNTGTVTLNLPDSFIGSEVQVYFTFVNAEASEAADSSYVSAVEVI